jgi:hypothetical protein
MTPDLETENQVKEKQIYGQAVCESIAVCISKLGFSEENKVAPPDFNQAEFCLVTDPYTQSRDLVGYWLDKRKQRIGQIRFNGEQGFYAEYDVAQLHPSKTGIFVEAINAWGKQEDIRVEAKLLSIPQ